MGIKANIFNREHFNLFFTNIRRCLDVVTLQVFGHGDHYVKIMWSSANYKSIYFYHYNLLSHVTLI